MKAKFPIGVLLFFYFATIANGQSITMIKANQITKWNHNESDTVYIINFWATWCKPCVEELPAFEKIGETYGNKKVRIIMVSNDFKKQIETKLIPFIKEKKMLNEVVYMNETDPNTWMGMVDPDWSGAIPATLILQGSSKFRKFQEGIMNFEELNQIIKSLNP